MVDQSDKIPVELIIRVGKLADLPALEWGGELAHYRRLFADAYEQVNLGRGIIWIAELTQAGLIGQLFISFVTYRTDLADGKTHAYLFGFRVRPEYRGLGVGTCMMHVVEADLIDRGFSVLNLNVGQDNISAHNFYRRLGYQIVGPDPGLWSYVNDLGQRVNVHEPAWRMAKNLRKER
jgi:ribosomal protein S18 acetylase RimI-like enzyme